MVPASRAGSQPRLRQGVLRVPRHRPPARGWQMLSGPSLKSGGEDFLVVQWLRPQASNAGMTGGGTKIPSCGGWLGREGSAGWFPPTGGFILPPSEKAGKGTVMTEICWRSKGPGRNLTWHGLGEGPENSMAFLLPTRAQDDLLLKASSEPLYQDPTVPSNHELREGTM